jgi:TonB-dependent SusC/RagA subfamily outer membrane receptor
MKNIYLALLFISTSLFAQQYDKDWNKVIKNENEGKVKTANQIVDKIYKKACAKKEEAQIIKCFFYSSKYLHVVDENAQTKILNNLKSQIKQISIPSQAILNLVYGKCLDGYLNKNRYTIQSRTNTTILDDDFLTWSASNFKNQIGLAFEKTLENETLLKNTPLTNYEPIFDFITLDKLKKESLFDYLIKENISFHSKKLNSWGFKPKDFKEYKNPLLGDSNEFTGLKLEFVKDTILKTVLSLYQKQETNHPSADNQLDRITFCNDYLLKSNENYLQALNALQKNAKEEMLLQKIRLAKAAIYSKEASKEDHPDYNIKSISIIDSILAFPNKSNSYQLALQKKQEINTKTLEIQLQKYIYNNGNSRAFVRYKNADNLKISFYKINQNIFSQFNNRDIKSDDLALIITEQNKSSQTIEHSLIDKKDYLEYSTEVLLPQLETGSYLVYFESETDSDSKKAFTYETITVSNLCVLLDSKNKTECYQVLDRKTGKPLENVTLESPTFSIKTNEKGVATFERTDINSYNSRYETIKVASSNDTIQVNKSYFRYNTEYSNNETEKSKGKVEFYLDRAIYRPGQTVYYKGIAFQKKQNVSNIVPKTTFKISIKDASHKEIKTFEVTTNDFGSFSGEFVLPKMGLTGIFSIEATKPTPVGNILLYNTIEEENSFWANANFEYSRLGFNVEEYKRPKFEVTFDPIKKSYQVNQNVSVTGFAKAFAGSNISDAKVQYEVRLTPYTLNSGYYYNQNGKSESILVGETKTDASGKFEINFIARPFENTTKEHFPVFDYSITATITDSNGETHKTHTNARIGYHSLMFTTTIPSKIETRNRNEITFTSTNLNGEFLPTKGEIKLYYVSSFSDKFKPRIWEKPDIETISAQDFERLFPYENNQNLNSSKSAETLLFSKQFDTENDKNLVLDFISNYKSGNYKVVFSAKDSFENPIETSTIFQLTQSKDKFNPNKLFTTQQINSDPNKDGFVLVKLTSVIPELYINAYGNYKSKIYFENTFYLQNNETVVKIPLKKEFEKRMNISFESVFENQTYYDQMEVSLKTEEPKLDWEVESFRNKIRSGSTENWSFKLKATNTEKESEILASMYDSSLDQFTKQNWNILGFNEYDYNSGNFKTSLGFDKTNSSIRNLKPFVKSVELNNETTKLIWFGFDFNETYSAYQQREYQKQLTRKIKKPLNAKLISGTITDDTGLPLPGVSLSINGTQRITSTDFEGYYEIEAAIGETLKISYVGLKTKIIAINSNQLDIQLEEEGSSLQEVVVTALGFKKEKKSLGYAVEVVEEDTSVHSLAGIDVKLEDTISGISIRGTTGNPANALYVVDGEPMTAEQVNLISPNDILSVDVLKGERAIALYGEKGKNGVIIITTKKSLEAITQVKARTNLSETAFFFPNLKTDSKGKVSFNFTSPEALTAWKLRLMAHNKNAVTGYLEKSVVTQKELMVMPNFPRFFREKDTIVITTKIANITKETKTGIAVLQLFDATTMQAIDVKMNNTNTVKNFTIPAYGNTSVSWKIYIPEGLQGVQYKVLAKSSNFSDGEENILPVLTNNILITESIPIWVRENSKKGYTFENLKNNTSTTLKNHQFTLEYTSNPSWLAIQSLPYLMEYEHECAEQTFSRYYANALATEIINSNPKIATVFETWRKNGKGNPKLEANEELKSVILAETPWLNDAQSEDEKKKNLALLFDLEKMKNTQEATFAKLKQKQKPSGGFAWFDGSEENEYITRHILAGLGHLGKLDKSVNITRNTVEIANPGITFIDNKFSENHKLQNQEKDGKLIWNNPNSDMHYLYTRSFYLEDYLLSDTLKVAIKKYVENVKENWLTYSLYEKGMAALVLNRFDEKATAKKILENLRETASNNEEWGMYWIANKSGWYWYQAPIETQALLIEAFSEVDNDTKAVDAMKVWLIKNKQTKNWPTTKATTEAVYALLLQGSDWLSVKDNTTFQIGEQKIVSKKLSENEKETETGYIKLNWKAEEIKKEMATISITNKSKVPGYGGVYWQYFENLDKIKNNSGTNLSIAKELYIKKNTSKGSELQKTTATNVLKVGDLVTVRLIITSKEDMEFIHLKDMRASCFEPIDVLSSYQYEGGLGFYKSTKDAATHFFFDRINKGTYVLEYDIRVNNTGNFSNGISTIESMYAPEFASHTKGIRVKTME